MGMRAGRACAVCFRPHPRPRQSAAVATPAFWGQVRGGRIIDMSVMADRYYVRCLVCVHAHVYMYLCVYVCEYLYAIYVCVNADACVCLCVCVCLC
jgi:hypothetical protein